MAKPPEQDAHVLIPPSVREKLLANFREGREDRAGYNPEPVVKIFTPDGAATWLITEMDEEAPDILYGIGDLGMGFVEFGTISLSELQSIRGGLRLPVERDLHFRPKAGIYDYLSAGSAAGKIVDPVSKR